MRTRLSGTLLCTFVALTLTWACRAEPSSTTPQKLEGKLVLKLPFRASQAQAPSRVRRNTMQDIGYFRAGAAGDKGGNFYGAMLCTDNQGRFYFYDPINPKLALLRCVARNGYEVARWKLPIPDADYRASVTPDGYVWIAANDYEIRKGNFPVVIYKFGQTKPIIDWRTKPPFDVGKFVEKTLGKKYFNALSAIKKEEATAWEAEFLGMSQGKIQLEITNYGVGYISDPQPSDKQPAITIRWTLSSDSKKTLQRDVYKSPTLRTKQRLASDGTQWYFADDYSFKTSKWSKAWLWKKGEQKGQPLITFEELMNPQGWWYKTFDFGKRWSNPPGFRVDGSGLTYLTFSQDNESYYDGEKTAVIFNKQKQPVAYIPWIPFPAYLTKWIFPLADGSGFYRQEKDDKELRIYFYALPKAK